MGFSHFPNDEYFIDRCHVYFDCLFSWRQSLSALLHHRRWTCSDHSECILYVEDSKSLNKQKHSHLKGCAQIVEKLMFFYNLFIFIVMMMDEIE